MIVSFLALDGAQGVHYYVADGCQRGEAAGRCCWLYKLKSVFDQYQGVKASSHPFIFI
jgi:hypothetical protein